jgi:hypothetical protein
LGGLGFFGRIGLRTGRGGGPAGWSSANTGFGSTVTVPELIQLSPTRLTLTGTVTGNILSWAKVTVKPLSGGVTVTEQGVRQLGPSEVRASTPGGADSS